MGKSESFFEEEGEKLEELMNPTGTPESDENKGDETPEESPSEEEAGKEPETPEIDEDKLPFHKHPRFKALVEEKNQYKKELEQMRSDMDTRFEELKESKETKVAIPDWFTELYGENETAWSKYQEYDKQTRESIKAEVKQEIESSRKSKDDEAAKWDAWINEQVDGLKESGLKFDKNELMKVMFDYKPTGDDGKFDFKKGYEIMNLLKAKDTKSSEARKIIADDSIGKGSTVEEKKWFTPDDMRGKGW